jgi:hypothetical protein
MIENPPSYNSMQLEDEQHKQIQYLRNSSKFPVLDHHTKIHSVRSDK